MTERPSGTVTFLFTDVEGSTQLWEQFPDAMPDALSHHDDIVRQAVEGSGGHVVKNTGDGFLAVFETAPRALQGAVDAQRQLAGAAWPTIGRLSARMGLHSGVAHIRNGDYFGGVLNRAARLMAVAHGGQIVCSQATANLARDALGDGLSVRDLGEHRLRDLGRTERIFQVDGPGLETDFPPLRSLDAYPSNLPLQTTSFVGRDQVLTDVAQALSASRLITLVGVGGVGKTRLALHLAGELLPAYPDGAWVCELASASDPEGAYQLVAASLGVKQRQGVSLAGLRAGFSLGP
jgi:class 3 adenylate cyclase